MAHSSDFPVFVGLALLAVFPGRDGVCATTGNLFYPCAGRLVKAQGIFAPRCQRGGVQPLLDGLIAVDGVDDAIPCAVKYYRGDDPRKTAHCPMGYQSLLRRGWSALA